MFVVVVVLPSAQVVMNVQGLFDFLLCLLHEPMAAVGVKGVPVVVMVVVVVVVVVVATVVVVVATVAATVRFATVLRLQKGDRRHRWHTGGNTGANTGGGNTGVRRGMKQPFVRGRGFWTVLPTFFFGHSTWALFFFRRFVPFVRS